MCVRGETEDAVASEVETKVKTLPGLGLPFKKALDSRLMMMFERERESGGGGEKNI